MNSVSENRIYKDQILATTFNGRRFKNLQPDEVKQLEWYANQSKDRFLIRRVFQGTLESTLRCEDCGNTSQNSEKFLDISLPVSEAAGSLMRKAKASPERMAPTKRQMRKEKRLASVDDLTENGAKDEVRGGFTFMFIYILSTMQQCLLILGMEITFMK